MNPRWFLAGGAAVAATALFQVVASPVRTHERSSRKEIAVLADEIAEARGAIQAIQAREPLVAKARAEFARDREERPASQTLVWFPGLINRHFRQFGLAAPSTRQTVERNDARLPGVVRSYWTTELPLADHPEGIVRLLDALTDFEKAEPAARVIELAIGPGAGEPGQRRATIAFSLFARE